MGPMDYMFGGGKQPQQGTVAGPDYESVMRYLTSPAQQMGPDQRRVVGGMAPGPSMHDPNPSPMQGGGLLETLVRMGILGGGR